MGEGGTGVAAIDTRIHKVVTFPRDMVAYGCTPRVVPSLDSTVCLVEVRGEGTLRWSPGSSPDPVSSVAGRVLLWLGSDALVMEADASVVRETRI
jgi:hypothetical protein